REAGARPRGRLLGRFGRSGEGDVVRVQAAGGCEGNGGAVVLVFVLRDVGIRHRRGLEGRTFWLRRACGGRRTRGGEGCGLLGNGLVAHDLLFRQRERGHRIVLVILERIDERVEGSGWGRNGLGD